MLTKIEPLQTSLWKILSLLESNSAEKAHDALYAIYKSLAEMHIHAVDYIPAATETICEWS